MTAPDYRDTNLQGLIQDLARHGLRLRGYWKPTPHETLQLACGQHPSPHQVLQGRGEALLALVGVMGSEFWPHFKASPFFTDGLPDPLDRWSRAIGDALALQYQGLALYPFDGPPWHPFQQWADRCEPTQPSRMMLRIHPEFGLWHAYRFALLVPAPLAGLSESEPAPQASSKSTDVCASCAGQPCLTVCPVQAYTGATFHMQACADHLHSPQGKPCMENGCQARLACPVGVAFRYTQEHAQFHMQAFARSH